MCPEKRSSHSEENKTISIDGDVADSVVIAGDDNIVNIIKSVTEKNNTKILDEVVTKKQERYFDAGKRVKTVRNELGIKTSEFIELTGLLSEREYKAIERGEKETPLHLLEKITQISGVNLEWLKHGGELRYPIEAVYFNPVERDLAFCARLNPQEYFLTLNEKDLHIGLVAQIGAYRYQVIDTGVTLDFWNWVESFWAIPAFYDFLERLSGPWHDIYGVILPPQIETKFYAGEIHFLAARQYAKRFGRNLLYDLLDLEETRRVSSYKRVYGGNWMPKVHKVFRKYLNAPNNKVGKQ